MHGQHICHVGLRICYGLLQSIIEDPLMRHSAILVFANKQDLVSRLFILSLTTNALTCVLSKGGIAATTSGSDPGSVLMSLLQHLFLCISLRQGQ